MNKCVHSQSKPRLSRLAGSVDDLDLEIVALHTQSIFSLPSVVQHRIIIPYLLCNIDFLCDNEYTLLWSDKMFFTTLLSVTDDDDRYLPFVAHCEIVQLFLQNYAPFFQNLNLVFFHLFTLAFSRCIIRGYSIVAHFHK